MSFGTGGYDFWVLKLDGNGEMNPSCAFIYDTSSSDSVFNAAVTATSVTNPSTFATINNTGVTGVVSPGTDTFLCFGSVEICNNGINDAGDGLVDCNDPDCPPCPTTTSTTTSSTATTTTTTTRTTTSSTTTTTSAITTTTTTSTTTTTTIVTGCQPCMGAERGITFSKTCNTVSFAINGESGSRAENLIYKQDGRGRIINVCGTVTYANSGNTYCVEINVS